MTKHILQQKVNLKIYSIVKWLTNIRKTSKMGKGKKHIATRSNHLESIHKMANEAPKKYRCFSTQLKTLLWDAVYVFLSKSQRQRVLDQTSTHFKIGLWLTQKIQLKASEFDILYAENNIGIERDRIITLFNIEQLNRFFLMKVSLFIHFHRLIQRQISSDI